MPLEHILSTEGWATANHLGTLRWHYMPVLVEADEHEARTNSGRRTLGILESSRGRITQHAALDTVVGTVTVPDGCYL